MQHLIDWVEAYVKYMDAMKKQIVSVKKEGGSLFVKKKNHEEKYFIFENLNDEFLNIIDQNNSEKTFVVCFNEKKNVDYLIKKWNSFKKHNHLNFIFVNLSKNEKWVVNPHMHSLVSDDKNLKQGLMSLHEGCL